MRQHPSGVERRFLPLGSGALWMVARPRGDGTYDAYVGRSLTMRAAQRRSGRCLRHLLRYGRDYLGLRYWIKADDRVPWGPEAKCGKPRRRDG